MHFYLSPTPSHLVAPFRSKILCSVICLDGFLLADVVCLH